MNLKEPPNGLRERVLSRAATAWKASPPSSGFTRFWKWYAVAAAILLAVNITCSIIDRRLTGKLMNGHREVAEKAAANENLKALYGEVGLDYGRCERLMQASRKPQGKSAVEARRSELLLHFLEEDRT